MKNQNSDQSLNHKMILPAIRKNQKNILAKLPVLFAALLALVYGYQYCAVHYFAPGDRYLVNHSDNTIEVKEIPQQTGDNSTENNHLISPNTASVEELCQIPGIGEKTAQAIINERENHGQFYFPEDLLCVYGIGKSKLESILPYLTFP